MSKFNVGDVVECVDDDGVADIIAVGKKYSVHSVDETNRLVIMAGPHGKTFPFALATERFRIINQKPEKPSKPAKKYTESDRRKAAKAVRLAQKKFADSLVAAQKTGIFVEWKKAETEHTIDISMEMSYQPETPKKRVYK